MIIDSFDTSEPILKLEHFYGPKGHMIDKCLILLSDEIFDYVKSNYQLKQIGLIGGSSYHFPIHAFEYKGELTPEVINAYMKSVANESYGYNEDQIVSSDVIGMRYGSLFDATQTMVCKLGEGLFEVQVVSWYDNENSYTSQMVRTIKYFAELA